MNPKVSVIVPVYNVENYLDDCIKSIINQTYDNIEVILIDDGSVDNSPMLCDNWADVDKRVKVFHQKNSGVSYARNVGIEKSSGDYILFVDSDDYIAETTIEKSANLLIQSDADILCFGVYRVNESGEIIESTEGFEQQRVLGYEEALTDISRGFTHDYVWNKLIRKEMFKGVSFPEGRLFEDIATTYKLFLNSEKVIYLPDELYYYRKRKSSIIGSMNAKTLNDLFVARKERYDFLELNYPKAAEAAFEATAISALNFYDISLWTTADRQNLDDAIQFLKINRQRAFALNNKTKLYYISPFLYRVYRKTKHRIGNVVKRIINKT